MKDLTMSFDDYISSKIKADKDFEKEFYLGYEDFKIGAMIKEMQNKQQTVMKKMNMENT